MSGDLLKNPLVEIVIVFVIILFVSTLSFAAGISGALTAAVASGVGLMGLGVFVYILHSVGRM